MSAECRSSQPRCPNVRHGSARRRRAFTLVEMLVVMGIIVLLVSVLVPTVVTSRRKAAAARVRRDIDTISVALEAYQQTWGSYPVFDRSAPASSQNADNVRVSIQSGDLALYTALTTRGRIRQGGIPYGPFLNSDSFKLDTINMQIKDKSGNPFLYVPANPAKPDLGKAFVTSWNNTGPQPLYDHNAIPRTPTGNPPLAKLLLIDMQQIMGDANQNGKIDPPPSPTAPPPETPTYTGPFLIWHPGADTKFGLQTMGTNTTTDDITNFDIPAQFRR